MDMGNVSRWRPRDIFREYQNVPPQLNLVSLSAHWLVWLEYGKNGWTINARDRRTSHTHIVDSSKNKNGQSLVWGWPLLSLSGDEIAWSYPDCLAFCDSSTMAVVHSYIMVRRLPFGKPRLAVETDGRCAANWPSLWGNVLVWEQEGVCSGQSGSNVWMRRLWSGKPRMLTTNYGGSVPATNGRYVAYDQGKPHTDRFTEWQATVLLDLRTNVRITVGGGRA